MSDLQLEAVLTANAGPLNAALQSGARGVQELSAEAVAANKAQATATTASASAVNTLTDSLKRVQAEGTRVSAAAKKQAEDVAALGVSARQTAAAMRTLPAQFTDIAVQLQSGANPLTILLQQGGQIKDSFGGIGPAIRAVASLITPFTVALGGGAAALGVMSLAAYQGYAEVASLNKQLALMGPTTANSTYSVMRMSEGIARSTREPIGAVRELAAEMLKIGGPVAESMNDGVRAGLALQRLTGQNAADVAQQFGGLSNGVATWAAKANASYGFLTAAQFEQVRSLEAQGRSAEATRLVLRELADTMDQRVANSMSDMDRRLQDVTSTWSKFWDTLKRGGDDKTAEERLKSLQDAMTDVEGKLPILDQLMLKLFPGSQAGRDAAAVANVLRQQLGAQEQAIRGSVNRTLLNQAEANATAKAEQDAIVKNSAQYQAAAASIEKAGAAKRLAEQTVALANRQAATELAFQRDEVSARDHQAELLKIELGRIGAQEAQLRALQGIEAARKPANEIDTLQQQAALVQFEAQRVALAEKRRKLLAEEEQGKRDIASKARSVGGTDDLRRLAAQDNAAVDQALRERSADSVKAQAEIVAANKAGAVAMIKDDRERGLAQIEIEREVLLKRLDLAGLSDSERQRAQDTLATWQLQREQQLTEQLKPEWQRRLEAWADTNRLMKDSYDSLMQGVVDQGERAFVNFMKTGKLNVRSLVDFMIEEFARLTYRKTLAATVSNGADGLLRLLGLGGGANLGTASGSDLSAFYDLGPITGGGATGTNELTRDMITLVHKGEAIVPKQFNPWAGGSGAGATGAGGTVQNITYNVPPGMSPAAFAGALEQNNRRLKAEVSADMQRPGRPLQRAAARSGRL